MGKITISFLIFGSIYLICFAAKTKFSEVQYGCISGIAVYDEVSPSLIQCVDSCGRLNRYSTRCMAVQYFAVNSMCRMYMLQDRSRSSVCGPTTPSLFAIPLSTRFTVYTGPLNWTDARDACFSSGRFLATITSQTEHDEANAVLSRTGFLGQSVWLGAKKTVSGGPFAWVTGTTFSYTAFEPGEPSNGTTENCLVTDGLWWDRVCQYAYPYLCE